MENLASAFPLLMAWLWRQKDLRPEDLKQEEVQQFIRKHADVLDHAVDVSLREVPLDEVSVRRLKDSNYVFSGIKTFHELNEALPSLVGDDGRIKPFNQFLKEVQKINSNYNVNYLRTEYNLAQASSLMAARWHKFEQDGDRYLLQYRTVGDKRVRRSHRMLHGITLPITSKFWNEYFPPNNWNCRCTVVQVRKGKYPESNEQEAMKLGMEATAGKYREMFLFNPGKSMTCFPAYNAYTRKTCVTCRQRPGNMELAANIPDNELCRACQVMKGMIENASERIKRYSEEDWERTYISADNHGFVVTQKERIKEAQASKQEIQKFEKEMRMCKVIADNGHEVEYLQGVNRPAGQTYDITIDGIKTDLKCIEGGAGNIVKYAKKALSKQGGEAVVFELPTQDVKFYEAITEARRKCNGRIFFYIARDRSLREVLKERGQ